MAETRIIEYSMGEAEIEGTPKRIVTFYQGANDAAVALDIPLVGIVESWVEKPDKVIDEQVIKEVFDLNWQIVSDPVFGPPTVFKPERLILVRRFKSVGF